MKELRLGIMKNKELAEWFGIAEGTFKNNKSNKLDILNHYAKFEETKGKVKILEIIEPVFSGKTSKTYYLVKELFNKEWDETGLDTCKYVAQKILLHYPNELNVTEDTIARRAREVRNELYGLPFERQGFGEARCEYIWCKKVDMNGYSQCVRLTEEEEKERKKIYKKFFFSDKDKDVLIAEAVDEGCLTQAQGNYLQSQLYKLNPSRFKSYLCEIKKVLGCTLIRGTQLCEKDSIYKQETN